MENIKGFNTCKTVLNELCIPQSEYKYSLFQELFLLNKYTMEPLSYYDNGMQSVFTNLKNNNKNTEFVFDIDAHTNKEIPIGVLFTDNDSYITLIAEGKLCIYSLSSHYIDEIVNNLNDIIQQLYQNIDDETVIMAMGYKPNHTFSDVAYINNRYQQTPNQRRDGLTNLEQYHRYNSCAMNVYINYNNERDLIQKLRLSNVFLPIIKSIFANSPIVEGSNSGYQSFQNSIQNDIENMLISQMDFVFERNFSLNQYILFLMQQQLKYIYRDGKKTITNNTDFIDFCEFGYDEHSAQVNDWFMHISSLRLNIKPDKNGLYIGGIDSSLKGQAALIALLKGLFVDEASVMELRALAQTYKGTDVFHMNTLLPMHGLNSVVNGIEIADVAKDLIEIAIDGLDRFFVNYKATRTTNTSKVLQESESVYLKPTLEMVQSKHTKSDETIRIYNDRMLKYNQNNNLTVAEILEGIHNENIK